MVLSLTKLPYKIKIKFNAIFNFVGNWAYKKKEVCNCKVWLCSIVINTWIVWHWVRCNYGGKYVCTWLLHHQFIFIGSVQTITLSKWVPTTFLGINYIVNYYFIATSIEDSEKTNLLSRMKTTLISMFTIVLKVTGRNCVLG